MLKWEKTGRTVRGDGSSTVTYEAHGKTADYCIESRKRPIAHANRPGNWMYTSYFLVVGAQQREFHTLMDAKRAAERIEEERSQEPTARICASCQWYAPRLGLCTNEGRVHDGGRVPPEYGCQKWAASILRELLREERKR